MRHLQGHFEHRQRGDMRRVRMDDAVHIRPPTVHPGVKTVGRVGNAVAFQNLQVLIDQQQIAGGYLIKTQAQLLRVIGARRWPAGGDLPSQTRVVTVLEQDAARERQLLPCNTSS